jgi:pimeloyl-ACP methyl ester carboxylesterase
VALFPVARSKRRANIVHALRDNAKGLRLPRLDSIKGPDLQNKTGVVIFLHGLMSTDAGTFDEFVKQLSAAPFAQPLVLVSWPHDTLASIDANAEDLSVLIEDTLGGSSLPVAFVCHSRGGLVARRTAVELMEIDKARWQPRLRGLITFGTPHDGAELAESGDELIGKLLLWRSPINHRPRRACRS